MSKVICEREDLVNIADAVRAKTGTSSEMTLGQIATGIGGISDSPENCMIDIINNTGYAITFHYLTEGAYRSLTTEATSYSLGAAPNSIFIIKCSLDFVNKTVSLSSSGVTIIENGIITHNGVRYIMFVVNDEATLSISLRAGANEPS